MGNEEESRSAGEWYQNDRDLLGQSKGSKVHAVS